MRSGSLKDIKVNEHARVGNQTRLKMSSAVVVMYSCMHLTCSFVGIHVTSQLLVSKLMAIISLGTQDIPHGWCKL